MREAIDEIKMEATKKPVLFLIEVDSFIRARFRHLQTQLVKLV